jgi:hypothetical protein
MKRKPRSKPTTLGQRLRAARLAAGLDQQEDMKGSRNEDI